MPLKPVSCLVGAFETQSGRFADQLELLASFERRKEPVARKFDRSIVPANGAFLGALVQSRMFIEDRKLQLFASSLSQVSGTHYRGVLELHPAMENSEPTLGLLGRYYGNVQDGAVTTEILGLASLEQSDEEEETPQDNSSNKDSGFHVDHSIHYRCRD
jgi:hypothetical protein